MTEQGAFAFAMRALHIDAHRGEPCVRHRLIVAINNPRAVAAAWHSYIVTSRPIMLT